jgi:hypothetical protein
MHTLLQMQATQPGAPPEQALQQLAEGRAGVQLRQPGESVVVSAGSVKSLDELPPELRKRVEELLASGTTSGHSVVLSAGPGKPLDELPPEVREQVEKALAGGAASGQVVVGGPSVSVTRKVTVRGPGGMEAGKTRCVNCGFESDAPFEACPQCGQARRRSWWRRLFGD